MRFFHLILFSPHSVQGQGILGAGAKTTTISDSGDDIERTSRTAVDRGAGRRLDALNPRTVSSSFDH